MATQPLTEELLSAGRKFLATTDELRVGAEGAAWLFDPVDENWRFFLVTSLIDELGPRELYETLSKVFRKVMPELPISMFAVYLASPSDKPFRVLRDRGIGVTESGNVNVDGWRFDYVYRAGGAPSEIDRPQIDVALEFRRRARDLLAA